MAAVKMFPELKNSTIITRKQVNEVVAATKVSYPIHITNKQNTVTRGVFHFNANLSPEEKHLESDEPEIIETEEEIEARIAERYKAMESFISAVANNAVNSLIIAGGSGLGKSFGVNKVLHKLKGEKYRYVFHRGYLKNTGLFRLLWEHKEPGQTIVIDDCDRIFSDEDSLNMLKAALELKQSREICWGSEKEFIDHDGVTIPRTFNYEGSIIFLTNLAFSELASGVSRNAPHLQALESRSLVIDLKIKTKREFMAKIKMTLREGMLKDKGFKPEEEAEILKFMTDHVDKLKELSLRMCEKIAVLYKMDKKNWKNLAETACLK